MLTHLDWHSMFVPTVGLLEIFIRGTLVYWVLSILLRVMRRDAGGLGIADVLFIIIVADASQNAMASTYNSLTEGFVLIFTLIFWNYAFDWLSYRFPWFEKLLRPPALTLIKNGVVNHRNRRRELITMEELKGQLREHGIEHLSEVKLCRIEGDGHISVVEKYGGSQGGKSNRESPMLGG